MDSVLKAKVIPNGPLQITGTMEVEKTDGTKETREGSTYLCRCGHSANKPYCDGAHVKMEFKG